MRASERETWASFYLKPLESLFFFPFLGAQQTASHEKISAFSLSVSRHFQEVPGKHQLALKFQGPPKTHKHTSQDATHPHIAQLSLGAPCNFRVSPKSHVPS